PEDIANAQLRDGVVHREIDGSINRNVVGIRCLRTSSRGYQHALHSGEPVLTLGFRFYSRKRCIDENIHFAFKDIKRRRPLLAFTTDDFALFEPSPDRSPDVLFE